MADVNLVLQVGSESAAVAYAQQANASAQASAASAESASGSATAANSSATQAANSASAAAGSATQANGYATNAGGSASAAAQSAAAAETAKTNAGNSATAAASSASTAATKAGEASASATSAASSATAAAESATSAASSATAASGSATTASTKASEAAASATAAQTAKTGAETAQGKAETAQGAAEAAAESISASAAQIATNTQDISDLRSALTSETEAREAADEALEESISEIVDESLNDKADVVVNTASGSIASFTDGAAMPVKGLTVNIDLVQSGSGDPSPTNIRPISGWDAVKVTRTGKNLLNYADYSDSYRITSVVKNENDSFTVTASNASAYIQHLIPVKAGQMYSIKAKAATNDSGNANQMTIVNVYDGNSATAPKLLSNVATTTQKQFVPTGNYVLVRHSVTGGSGAGVGTIWSPQIVRADSITDDDYEPYKSIQSVTIQLGQTVYGGRYNAETGKLIIDMAGVDMGGLTWTNYNGTFYADIPNAKLPSTSSDKANAICSMYRVTALTRVISKIDDIAFAVNNGLSRCNVYDSAHTADTGAVFKQYLSDNNAKLVYELASPVEVALSSTEISTILGQNNIFADTGDVSVEYGADTKLYIEDSIVTPSLSMIAPIENGVTASQAYTAGQYFLHNNVFCKAKADIASGATFTLGTNYTETTIGAELYTALH